MRVTNLLKSIDVGVTSKNVMSFEYLFSYSKKPSPKSWGAGASWPSAQEMDSTGWGESSA